MFVRTSIKLQFLYEILNEHWGFAIHFFQLWLILILECFTMNAIPTSHMGTAQVDSNAQSDEQWLCRLSTEDTHWGLGGICNFTLGI